MADILHTTFRGRWFRGAFIFFLTVLLASAGAQRPASAQGKAKSKHGEWYYVCDTPPGASSEQCALIQSVISDNQQNIGITVVILRSADKKLRLMRVLAPLGVLLPLGLGLKVDGTDVGNVPFLRCAPNGCLAEVRFDDDLADKMTTGKEATFIIFDTPEQGIGIPIDLGGLTEALPLLN